MHKRIGLRGLLALASGLIAALTFGVSPAFAGTPGPKSSTITCSMRYLDSYHDAATGSCRNLSSYYNAYGRARMWIKCLSINYYWVEGSWHSVAPGATGVSLGTMRCASSQIFSVTYESQLL